MTEQQLTPLWTDAEDRGITHEHLTAFLRGKGMTEHVAGYEGPELPSDPGACLVFTWLPGPGFSLEQMLDTPAFQVRTIGPQNNPDDARILADMIDRAFTAHRWPEILGSRYVVEVRRAGGAPALDRVDDAGRSQYVCTYLADVEAD